MKRDIEKVFEQDTHKRSIQFKFNVHLELFCSYFQLDTTNLKVFRRVVGAGKGKRRIKELWFDPKDAREMSDFFLSLRCLVDRLIHVLVIFLYCIPMNSRLTTQPMTTRLSDMTCVS